MNPTSYSRLKHKLSKKNIKRIKLTPYKSINSITVKRSKYKDVSSYKSPRLRSEYGRKTPKKSSPKHSSRTRSRTRSRTSSNSKHR